LSPGTGEINFESWQGKEEARVQATGRADLSKEQADLQQLADANTGQSTECHLPKHHITQSEYFLNPWPTSNVI